jgi:hypothetical protein
MPNYVYRCTEREIKNLFYSYQPNKKNIIFNYQNNNYNYLLSNNFITKIKNLMSIYIDKQN